MVDSIKLEKLQVTFPLLTDTNQQYVLGVVTGLKFAQNRLNGMPKAEKDIFGLRLEPKGERL